MRETGVLRLGGQIVAAAFAPQGERLLVASSDGRVGLYHSHSPESATMLRTPGAE